MFRHLLKIVHLVSVAAFGGAVLVSWVLADDVRSVQPGGFAAVRQAIAAIGDAIVLPSLIVLLLSGMLLVVARPALVAARWVWAKAAIGLAVGAVAIFVIQPAVRRASVLASEAVVGAPGLAPLQRALDAEQIGTSINLALLLVAIALGVWRPRLGQTSSSSAGEAP